MRTINEIEAGYYRTRLRRGAPFVPVWFYYGPSPDPDDPEGDPMERERSWEWQCILRGECQSAQRTLEISHSRLEPITEGEYRFMLDEIAWCAENDFEDPVLQPTTKIDLNKLPPAF